MESPQAQKENTGANTSPLVSGSLWKAIWLMSWPLIITTQAASLVGMIDVQVAGYVGAAAQAAVGLAEQIIFVFSIFLLSIGAGTTAIVARAYGEGDIKEASFATAQSLCVSILTGITLCIISLITTKYALPAFTKSADVLAMGQMYLGVFGFYIVPFSIVCISNAAFRAIGDAKTPLAIVGTEVIINTIGDYATVLGNWPVPGLGIKGIAFSATAGAIAAAILAIWRISKSPLKDSLNQLLPMAYAMITRILRIGIPAAFQRLSWAISVFVLFFILSKVKDPTAALASWSIGIRIEGLLFMPLMALSLAVASIVGQNLGANQTQRAVKASWNVTGIGVLLMIILGTVLYIYATTVAQFMSHDPSTIEYTASYLRYNAIAEPFLALNMILGGALQGAGDTRTPMWISLFGSWIIRLPLAWFLTITLGKGTEGAWISMTTSNIIAAVLILIRFQIGDWTKVKV